MKKFYSIFALALLLSSCGAFNRTISGNTEKDLIKQVSVETGCSEDKITIVDKVKNMGNATYSLDVCGKKMVYKQIGSVFMSSEDANKLFKR